MTNPRTPEKIEADEDAADAEALRQALDEDDGERIPLEDVARDWGVDLNQPGDDAE